MGSFGIGLSGLKVAQHLIELTSTNIANATTEGYHRQEPIIRSLDLGSGADIGVAGALIATVKRGTNELVEKELVRQESILGQTSTELDILRLIEGAFGEVGSGGLEAALNKQNKITAA